MTEVPTSAEVNRFSDLVVERLGLHFDESKLNDMAKVLHRRAQARRENCTQYLANLEDGGNCCDELYLLASELTVTETYFLRNIDQFRAYVEVALPDRLAAKSDGETVRLLSAGCSSGEEPYSLAIMASENCTYALNRIAITALDVNAAMLNKARRGRYTNWSLRDFPKELKARWFEIDAEEFVLDPTIREKVHFEQGNLTHDSNEFLHTSSLDIVFCRNVLMYFSPHQAREAIARIARALLPGGYLFLGHAETLRGLSNDFHLCHTHGTFYYQRKDGVASMPPAAARPTLNWQPAAMPSDTHWIAEIQRASKRIQALSVPTTASAVISMPDIAGQPAPHLRRAMEFLQNERYDQTLVQLNALPSAHELDPDVLLLKSVSLSHSGELQAARETCQALLACDEFNAGAYYVLALCCEGTADVPGAIKNYQTATHLDPGFAMPRLRMGLLARRKGDAAAAVHDLELALPLLQSEDASRLLLFAGGFRREALIALCRAELIGLGSNS